MSITLLKNCFKTGDFKQHLYFMNYINHDKIYLQHFYVFYNFFYIYIYIYIKISKDSSGKHYQNNKELLLKKAGERYQKFSKEENEKKQQYSH